MSINSTLEEEIEISKEDQERIEKLHRLLENMISSGKSSKAPCDREKFIKHAEEFKLFFKEIWEFDEDYRHTWIKKYLFRNRWAGRKFECKDTGVVFTIPSNVSRGDLFEIGNGYLDVGDGYYSRKGGNVVEVV